MSKIDTVKLLQIKIDSLEKVYNTKIGCLSHQIGSLSHVVEKDSIAHNFFTDILIHQGVQLSVQTGIFTFIVLTIVGLFAYVNWKVVFEPNKIKMDQLEKDIIDSKKSISDINEINRQIIKNSKKYEQFRATALRALYEAQDNLKWKIIHHIRYIEWFNDNNDIGGLKARLKILLEDELAKLKKSNLHEYNSLKNFEYIDGLKSILKKIIQSKDKEVSESALNILNQIS